MLWRIIFAVIGLVLFNLLIEPLSRIIGLPLTGDVLMVIRICVAGIAIYYVLSGAKPSLPA